MRVRGTMEHVPPIEVNIDTVYIRKNITWVSEDVFEGWEYDEVQYNKDEFIGLISEENESFKIRQIAQDAVIEELLFNIIPNLGV